MSHSKFFKKASQEVSAYLYSHIEAPRDFLAVWLANNGPKQRTKRQQRTIELALFNKEGIKFYPAQIKILTTLLNSEETLKEIDPEHLAYLGRKLATQLNDPNLSIQQLIQGLKLKAAINKVPLFSLDIPSTLVAHTSFRPFHFRNVLIETVHKDELEVLFDVLKNKLSSLDSELYIIHIVFLTLLARKVDKKTLELLVDPLRNILSYNDSLLSGGINELLSVMATRLDEQTLAPILDSVKQHLSEKKGPFIGALRYVATLAPKINKEIMEPLVNSIKEIKIIPGPDMEEKPEYVCTKALHCFTKLAPAMDKNLLELIIEPVIKQLAAPSLSQSIAAAECLAAFSSEMTTEIRLTLVDSIKNKLKDEQENIRFRTLVYIPSLVPTMDKEMREDLIHLIKNTLNDNSPKVRASALDCLAELVLDKEIEEHLIDSITNKLNDDHAEVRDKAIHCLKVFAPRMKTEMLHPVTELVKKMNNDPAPTVRISTLYYLGALYAIKDTETPEDLINVIQTKLNDRNEWVREVTFECLTQFAASMRRETLENLLNVVKKELDGIKFIKSKAILKFLVAAAPRIDAKILEHLVQPVLCRLNASPSDVRHAACRCLAAFASKINPNTLKNIIDHLQNKLDSQDKITRKQTLDWLAELSPFMDKNTQVSLLTPVKKALVSLCDGTCLAALSCLLKFIPALDQEMVVPLIEPVKNLLRNKNPDIRTMACRLLCFILINNNFIFEIETSPTSTLEELVIHTVADWVARINAVTDQPEHVVDTPNAAAFARSL